MEMLDLPTLGSLCLDGLPSPWDPQKMLMEAVFSGSSGSEDACLETTIASSGTETPYCSTGNPYGQVGSWQMQALKCTETSSDTSSLQSMVLDNSWAPPATSGSSAHSSDACSEVVPAADNAGAAPVARVVRRTRARRGQHAEAAATQSEPEQVQPQRLRRQRKPRVQEQAVEQPSCPRPVWATCVGPTLSGVLRPFETVKGYGAATDSRTLQAVNATLKKWQVV